MAMKLTLPLPPSSNRYWRSTVKGVLLSADARIYREMCQLAVVAQSKGMVEGPVKVTAMYYFPNMRGDLDNRLKQLLDGLQGSVLVNDSQVVEIHAKRLIDKSNPRVEVELEEVA